MWVFFLELIEAVIRFYEIINLILSSVIDVLMVSVDFVFRRFWNCLEKDSFNFKIIFFKFENLF